MPFKRVGPIKITWEGTYLRGLSVPCDYTIKFNIILSPMALEKNKKFPLNCSFWPGSIEK